MRIQFEVALFSPKVGEEARQDGLQLTDVARQRDNDTSSGGEPDKTDERGPLQEFLS